MKQYYERIEVNGKIENLPKEFGEYITRDKLVNRIFRHYRYYQSDVEHWLKYVDWYLQPIPQPLQAELIAKMEELIKIYQNFTQWILRHTIEIAQSNRGIDYLRQIKQLESEIEQLKKEIE